jgi:glucokinase
MKPQFIGIDIGGTLVKGVLVDGEKVREKTTLKTKGKQQMWQNTVAEVFWALTEKTRAPIAGIGLSAPGIADRDSRKIISMPGRLAGLEGFDWTKFLKQEVYVLNDAHAALVCESGWGVAKNESNVVMFTLGTGVGGGLLIDGKLFKGFLQRAGHLGHISIDSHSDQQDITGISGSLEDAIGEATLKTRSLGKFKTTDDLVSAYNSGDTWATYVWLTSVRKLSLGIVSICNAVSPDLVVLAGGITAAGEQLTGPLSTFMNFYEWRPTGEATPIKIAKFKEFSGALGAALFAQSKQPSTL